MPETERRYFRRVQKVIEFHCTTSGLSLTGRIRDLSEGGVFVDTPDPLPAGTPVSFTFAMQPEQPILGRGLVRWCQGAVGMGIQFLTLSEEDRATIRRFVAMEPPPPTPIR